MVYGRIVIGAAEWHAMEVEITRRAELLSAQADRIAELERAIHDHRTATDLSWDGDDAAQADSRLWGMLP